MNYILYNEKSRNGNQANTSEYLKGMEAEKLNVIGLNYKEFLEKLNSDDKVILVGGDGTLNHFVNDIDCENLPCKFYFLSSGTGNDFQNDMKDHIEDGLIYLNDCVKDLPTVTIDGKTSKFINGIGFGIDGYCCEVGDDLQAKSDKPVNYTSIAIKGLLFHFKRPNAKVTVDGEMREYKKVWLAPTMLGKFYGGGMMVAPAQDRFNQDKLLTNVVMHKACKLKTLFVFPSIFKGEHIKHTEMIDVRTGKEFTVEFDKPTALQIDGETVRNVLKYTVKR